MDSEVAIMQPTIKSKPHARASAAKRKTLAEAAGLIELEVDVFIAGSQFGEVSGSVAGFVGAEGDRVFKLGEQGVLSRRVKAVR